MDSAAILDGVPITAILRYTRVWHKRADRWQLAAGHMSMVPA
jgi:ketosteroid isomerase-like protein